VSSLIAMIVVTLVLLSLNGPTAFWTFGLMLTFFVGPVQSSARTQMLRMSAEGKEGVAFGLYTTTGRAASYLAPAFVAIFIAVFGADRAGLGGIAAVLAIGMLAMLFVRVPRAAAVSP